jgi:hypothetical protein
MTAKRWQEIADEHGAQLRIIECVCSDLDVHHSRVNGRVRGVPGWHGIVRAHVECMRDEFPAITVEHFQAEAVDLVEANVQTVLDYLA